MNSITVHLAIGACCLLSIIVTQCSSSIVPTSDTSNGSSSVYLETCCNQHNLGLSIIQHKDDDTISMIMCPAILPVNCPMINYSSCLEISLQYPNSVSGYYNVTIGNGSCIEVYCDMKGHQCDGEGGWTRIAYINTTLPNATCPEGLELEYYDDDNLDHGVCKRNGSDLGCNSVYYSSNGYQYSQVCGQARGYSYHAHAFYYNNYYNLTLDSAYVDGVSITRGDPRQHIWTYAVGHHIFIFEYGCPCIIDGTESVPLFVGNDYYCEELVYDWIWSDALWDGADCESYEEVCCEHPNMPWFLKQIGEETSDDIEVRLCYYSGDSLVTVNILEIFVK